ncbi:hypothetical protein LXL04_035293 [Taraxacum kok-saghyz]
MDSFIEPYSPYASLSFENVPLEVKLASLNPKKRAGRKKFRETRHPVYRGVRMRDNGKWAGSVCIPRRLACLNFADSVWRLPVPKSSNISDIQMAAAEAAEAFRHTVDEVEIVETELPEVEFYMEEDDVF